MIDNFYFYTNNGRYVEKTLFETEDRVIYADTTIELDYSIEDFNTLQFILRSAYAYEGDKLDTVAFTIAVTEAVENYNNPNEPFTFYSKDLSGAEMYVHGYFLDASHFYVMSAQGCCIHKVLGMTTSHVDEPELETDTVYISDLSALRNALDNCDLFMPLEKKNGKLICYDFPWTEYSNYKDAYVEDDYDPSTYTRMTQKTLTMSIGDFKNNSEVIPTSDERYPLYVGKFSEGVGGFYYCEKPLGFQDNQDFYNIIKIVLSELTQGGNPSQVYKASDNDDLGYYTEQVTLDRMGDQDVVVSFRNWDTSNVTDMSYAFSENAASEEDTDSYPVKYLGIHWLDVTNWDTSNVTNMSNMFNGLSGLGDIFGLETWDTSKVTDMSNLFYDCGANVSDYSLSTCQSIYGERVKSYMLTLIEDVSPMSLSQVDISRWKLNSLENASHMFAKSNITIPLEVSAPNLTDMSYIFSEARTLRKVLVDDDYFYPVALYGEQPLLEWNVPNVTDMSGMFYRSMSIFDLSDLNTSSVTNMSNMFNLALSLYDLRRNLTFDDEYIFYDIDSINHLATNNVTNMSGIFKNTYLGNIGDTETYDFNLGLNLAAWNTSKVTDMSEMFCWDINRVDGQFDEHTYIPFVPIFNTNISTFATGRVQNFSKMFFTYHNYYQDPNNHEEIEIDEIRRAGGDVSTWNTSSGTNMSYMFYNGKAKGYSGFTTDFVTDMSYMFYRCNNHDNLANNQRECVEDWSTSNVANFSHMFEKSYFIPGVDKFRVINPTNNKIEKMFYLCKYGTSDFEKNYIYDFSAWDTSGLTTLADMFHFYSDIYASGFIEGSTRPDTNYQGKMIGFDQWDTSNVTTTEGMFMYCPINLDVIDIGNCDVTLLRNITNMFFCAVADTVVLPPEMFYNQLQFEGNDSAIYWDTGYSSYPFDYCGAYTIQCDGLELDEVYGSDAISKIRSILFGGSYSFKRNQFLRMNARNWDVGANDLDNILDGTHIYKIDFSGWDVSEVSDFSNMFRNNATIDTPLPDGYYDNRPGGVLDYSSLDDWNPSYDANFSNMCVGNLQTNENYAQEDGYHYGEQIYRLPQWNDGWWLNPNDLLHQSQNIAPDGSRYTLNSFDENEFKAVCDTGYYGSFIPNILTDISATYDEFTPYASTPLDNLKDHLEVTGYYSTSSASRLLNNNEYTLSGTLVADSTVTITATATDMNGDTFTDTFSVDVLPTIVSISAAFNQSTHSVYVDTPLNDLKQYLTVTGTTDGGGTISINNSDIMLSGSLAIGTSAVLVSFNSGEEQTLTDTISVTVSKSPISLTATFNQGSAIITPSTPLNDLKQYLTVTALYNDMTSETIASTDYTLSGTLEEGTSVITASYLAPDRTTAVTATFNVTVTPD